MSPVRAEKDCETLSSKLSDMPNKPSWTLREGLDPLAFGEDRRAAAGLTGLTFRCAYFPSRRAVAVLFAPRFQRSLWGMDSGVWGCAFVLCLGFAR